MANSAQELKTIGEFIDRVEQVREELLALQRSMEKVERTEPIPSTDDGKDT
jgi:hypothetical protein